MQCVFCLKETDCDSVQKRNFIILTLYKIAENVLSGVKHEYKVLSAILMKYYYKVIHCFYCPLHVYKQIFPELSEHFNCCLIC